MNNVNNQSSHALNEILKEYAGLPEYSGMSTPNVGTKSLFGDYPINIAATRGLMGEVATLLAHGANINAMGEHGYTPLHNAVEQNHIEIVRFLLKSGADATMSNDDGDTPVELAKLMGYEGMLRLMANS